MPHFYKYLHLFFIINHDAFNGIFIVCIVIHPDETYCTSMEKEDATQNKSFFRSAYIFNDNIHSIRVWNVGEQHCKYPDGRRNDMIEGWHNLYLLLWMHFVPYPPGASLKLFFLLSTLSLLTSQNTEERNQGHSIYPFLTNTQTEGGVCVCVCAENA